MAHRPRMGGEKFPMFTREPQAGNNPGEDDQVTVPLHHQHHGRASPVAGASLKITQNHPQNQQYDLNNMQTC